MHFQRPYFSPQAPKRLADEMVYPANSLDHWMEIRNFSKPGYHYAGDRFEPCTLSGELERTAGIVDEKRRKAHQQKLLVSCKQLREVRERVAGWPRSRSSSILAAVQATPRTLQRLQLIRKMITDTGRLFQLAVPDQTALTSAAQRLGR